MRKLSDMRSALFWDITRRRVVIVYRRFGKTYRSHLPGSRVRAGKKESWLETVGKGFYKRAWKYQGNI
jgi:hypothetical protein